MKRYISVFLLVILLAAPVYAANSADFFDDFAKVRYQVSEFLTNPGLLMKYVENEYIYPIVKKDPYSKYKNQQRIQSSNPEPKFMKNVRKKFNIYFSRLNGYTLTADDIAAIKRLGIKDVSMAVMDNRRTYYLKHVYIIGDKVRVDSHATEHMVSISPKAAQELSLMLDNIMADNFISTKEARELGTWGKQRYESGDIAGKRKDIETILNFLLGGR